jgi:hypothetical protein
MIKQIFYLVIIGIIIVMVTHYSNSIKPHKTLFVEEALAKSSKGQYNKALEQAKLKSYLKKQTQAASSKNIESDTAHQAEVLLSDGNRYEVNEITFYGNHTSRFDQIPIMYAQREATALYLSTGPIWRKIDFSLIDRIDFSELKISRYLTNSSSESVDLKEAASVDVQYQDGSKLKGEIAFSAYGNYWYPVGYLAFTGKTKVLDQEGDYFIKLSEVKTIENNSKDFKVSTLKGDSAIVSALQFYWFCEAGGVQPLQTALPEWTKSIRLTIAHSTIDYNFDKINSISFEKKGQIRLGTKIEISLHATRLYAKLVNGDVIFTNFFNPNGEPIVKEIIFNEAHKKSS